LKPCAVFEKLAMLCLVWEDCSGSVALCARVSNTLWILSFTSLSGPLVLSGVEEVETVPWDSSRPAYQH
jgi:hypothetical protein